jgi:hypothetical protein
MYSSYGGLIRSRQRQQTKIKAMNKNKSLKMSITYDLAPGSRGRDTAASLGSNKIGKNKIGV